ncbi:trigger factor [Arcanobacterium ihumii]|uniref:trigger factor n=1 Tax=Arcanobacterium ihumii TaxID=2138162 RepID=UPI000F524673|nr:trigger factor [Arcanobacterium ihumii]
MKNSVEYLSETRVQLDVAVSAEEFQPAYEKAAKSLAKQVNIPGFRPGKAPRRVLEANIGKGYIIEQAINDNLDTYYQQAVVEADVRPMSRPEVSINEVPEMNGKGDTTELKFTVEVEVRPEISLPNPADITIEVPSTEVTDEDVESALVDLQERFATLTEVKRKAAKGDYVNLDLVAKIGDEEVDDVAGVSYRIGDGNMLEGQDEALTGAKAGDVVEFTAKLAGGDHEGEEANVTVTVHSVKESVLPEADDEFAQLASEFDTIEELKNDLRESAAKSKADEQLMGAEQKFIEEIEKLADFPLPQAVIDEEVANHLQNEGKDAEDEHGKEIRAEIEKQLKLQLLLDEYAEGFGVNVGQDELLNFLLQQAQMYGMDPNQFIQAAAQANQLNAFAGELARNKGVIAAMRLANVVDDKGKAVDVAAVLGEAPEDEKTPEFNKKATRKVTKKATPKKATKEAAVEEAETKEAPVEGSAVEAPAKSALKAEWIAYRVATGELTEAEAKKMTKDELVNFGA